jgi:hypothetical protein
MVALRPDRMSQLPEEEPTGPSVIETSSGMVHGQIKQIYSRIIHRREHPLRDRPPPLLLRPLKMRHLHLRIRHCNEEPRPARHPHALEHDRGSEDEAPFDGRRSAERVDGEHAVVEGDVGDEVGDKLEDEGRAENEIGEDKVVRIDRVVEQAELVNVDEYGVRNV